MILPSRNCNRSCIQIPVSLGNTIRLSDGRKNDLKIVRDTPIRCYMARFKCLVNKKYILDELFTVVFEPTGRLQVFILSIHASWQMGKNVAGISSLGVWLAIATKILREPSGLKM